MSCLELPRGTMMGEAREETGEKGEKLRRGVEGGDVLGGNGARELVGVPWLRDGDERLMLDGDGEGGGENMGVAPAVEYGDACWGERGGMFGYNGFDVVVDNVALLLLLTMVIWILRLRMEDRRSSIHRRNVILLDEKGMEHCLSDAVVAHDVDDVDEEEDDEDDDDGLLQLRYSPIIPALSPPERIMIF
ncbi:hypothetical protein BC829DRAFT_429565 [Chytridium lagenaria]|nr:hypothetical protein BC829DRAFT_429565 [Chytridium lagenaria]